MAINGTSGNDTLPGTAGADLFRLRLGGDDTASGLAGDDSFYMGSSFTALDAIDGGADTDKVVLNGDYTSGVIFGATTMTNVEVLRLGGAFDYSLTTHDATVAAGAHLTVNAGPLGVSHHLTFDGSAETDGHFVLIGSAATDTLTGGAKGDRFFLTKGSDDTANGGGGNDRFVMGGTFEFSHVDGGSGYDTVTVEGSYKDIDIDATMMTGVEKFVLLSGTSRAEFICNGNSVVAAGETLTVDGSALTLAGLEFNGFLETDGHFIIIGGAEHDGLTGGQLSDTFLCGSGGSTVTGSGGADDITCGSGSDQLDYDGVSDSRSTGYDTIHGFDAANDFFQLRPGVSLFPTVVAGASGSVDIATFDSDMGAAIDDNIANAAKVVTITGGDLIGHEFLFVDVNGNGFYNAASDFLFDITGYTGTIVDGTFT